MKQTETMVETLKRVLRAQKVTYATVAQQLDLSETSVKRLFSKSQFTLDRLEQICAMVGMSIFDLAREADTTPDAVTELTPAQEQELLADPKLLLVTFSVLNHWQIDEIAETFQLTEAEIVKRLTTLDRLGMIELLPENRVRRLTARNFTWRKNGPVQSFVEKEIKTDFFNSHFAQKGEHLRFIGGMLSRESVSRMHRAIDRLGAELDEYVQSDADLPTDEKLGVGAVFAIRPWEVPTFARLRRKPADKKF